MTAQWKTPPNINPSSAAAARAFIAAVKPNIGRIKEALILNSFPTSLKPYLSAKTVVNVIDKIVVGPTHEAEGGWADHPNDNGGPTMRGVILITFRGLFDKIFINTKIVEQQARAFKSTGWATGEKGSPGWELGKQVLYQVCGDADIASLFVFEFAASNTNRSPAAVMSTDPWLGFLMHQAAWASGGGYFRQYKYGPIFQKYGWNGTTNIATFVKSIVQFDGRSLTADTSANLVGEILGAHANWITANTKPGMRLEPFKKGWLNRLVYTPSISWTHSVISIVNAIDSKSLTSIPAEQAYLDAKAKYYKQLLIEFPTL